MFFAQNCKGVCKKDGKMRQFILKKACFDLLKQQNKACTVLLFFDGNNLQGGDIMVMWKSRDVCRGRFLGLPVFPWHDAAPFGDVNGSRASLLQAWHRRTDVLFQRHRHFHRQPLL